MENVKLKVEGSKLTIEVDLSQTGTPSGSGKSLVVASTKGNVTIPGAPGGVTFLGLNIYRKLQT